MRHAFADVGGNANLRALVGARSRGTGRTSRGATCSTRYRRHRRAGRCCCGPTRTALHPLRGAEEALDLLPDGQLRVLPGTGYLIAYDDPVGRRTRARRLLARLQA